MTVEESPGPCDLCGHPGAVKVEPARRTLARGADRDDPSLSVIAVLPDVVLCAEHAEAMAHGELVLGWCDNEGCRIYGEAGQASVCGEPFRALKR